MNLLPKIKKCPCCSSINLLKINGITYKNEFHSLSQWTLKKKINCRKCKIELGLFLHNKNRQEKIVWMEILRCEDHYHNYLKLLQTNKNKFKKYNDRYDEIIKEINEIQNKIRSDQVKIKIKLKIQNRGVVIRQAY